MESSGPQREKHLPQCPLTGKFFRWRHFACLLWVLSFYVTNYLEEFHTNTSWWIEQIKQLVAGTKPKFCRETITKPFSGWSPNPNMTHVDRKLSAGRLNQIFWRRIRGSNSAKTDIFRKYQLNNLQAIMPTFQPSKQSDKLKNKGFDWDLPVPGSRKTRKTCSVLTCKQIHEGTKTKRSRLKDTVQRDWFDCK